MNNTKIKATIKNTLGTAPDVVIDIDQDENIRNLINRIANMTAQDPNGIGIQYQGIMLDEGKKAKDFSIRDGSVLEVVPKSRVGGRSRLPSPDTQYNLPTQDDTLKYRMFYENHKIKSASVPIYSRPGMYPNMPLTEWEALIPGRGIWKGKTYKFYFIIPPEYADVPPIVRLQTPIWPLHPNINTVTGVCLNILGGAWRPQYTLLTVYRSIEWLFDHPNWHGERPPDVEVDRSILDDTKVDNSLWRKIKEHWA